MKSFDSLEQVSKENRERSCLYIYVYKYMKVHDSVPNSIANTI